MAKIKYLVIYDCGHGKIEWHNQDHLELGRGNCYNCCTANGGQLEWFLKD